MAARVRMYGTRFCGYCFLARRLLEKRGIAFDDIDVSRDRELRAKVAAETGDPPYAKVPMIFVDDRFIGGWDQLHDLDRDGELSRLGLAQER